MTTKEKLLKELFRKAIDQAEDTDYVMDSEGNDISYNYTDKENASAYCVEVVKKLINIESIQTLCQESE
jgi:hypothetical protein